MTSQLEQRSPEWHEARRNRITASMVGAILGLSPYMTRASAMRTMVRAREDVASEFEGNVATNWGVQNEDGARWEYEIHTGASVEPVGFVAVEDWAGASPDGLLGDDGLLEIKCPFGIRNDDPPKFKTLPEQPHYQAQIQFQLWATGRQWCHFWQWTPHGTDLVAVDVSEEWQAENLPRLRQFYAEFLAEAADDHIADERVIIDTPRAHAMTTEWDEIAEQMERLTERKADLLADMVALAGERSALIAGRKLTLTKRAGSVSYAKVVKENCPKVDLEPYRGKPSENWGLR